MRKGYYDRNQIAIMIADLMNAVQEQVPKLFSVVPTLLDYTPAADLTRLPSYMAYPSS